MITIKHPPSIISIDDKVCIGRYSAYVYKYTNTTNGKWYVGWHPGMFDGTYWHSSKNEEFKKVFSDSQPTLELEILSTGLNIDMMNLESKILTDQKVKKNPLSYNEAGAPTGNKEIIDMDKVEKAHAIIMERIASGEYEIEDLNLIASLNSIQVREEAEEKSHITRIRDGVMETGLEFQNPVIIWEGRDPTEKGKDVRGDGNHTILALLGLKNFNKVKTLRISEEFSTKQFDLNILELRQLGLKFNPRQTVAKLETTDTDALKQLAALLEKGVKIDPKDTEYGKNICKQLGYKGKKPAHLCRKAIKIYTKKMLSKAGLKVAIYDKNHPDNLKQLNRKAESLRNSNSIVVVGNTAYVSKILRSILESVTDLKLYDNRHNIHLVCHHNGEEKNKKEWDAREKVSLTNLVNNTLSMMIPVTIKDDNGIEHKIPRKFHIHEMDFYQSDIS
tara:strand:- start:48 stop:1385 length:1338 start_codon:yes stop_codon:yes gene_type:complete